MGTSRILAVAAMLVVPAVAAAAPASSWTGCYGGVNAGGARTSSQVSFTQGGNFLTGLFSSPPVDVAYMQNLGSPTIGATGFTGGGQLGCNYQTGSAVWGVETDINYLHTRGSYSATGILPSEGHVVGSTVSVSTNWLYTLRGRLGFMVDRALIYATGGLAAGDERFSQNFFHDFNNSSESGSVSSTRAGWTIGGGVEYAFTDSVSAKAEYLHVDLGSVGFNSANNLLPTYTASNSARLREDIVRVGVDFRFVKF